MVISDFQSTLLPLLEQVAADQIFVLADSNTQALVSALPLSDIPCLVIEAGEESKNIQQAQRIWQFLLDHHATRQAVLINVGGGMITDLGGFAAATFKRGIRFIHIPTDLLAMVDASIGGKAAINMGNVKNSVGLFASPWSVLAYPPFLLSLPDEQWLSGYGEVLKTALLSGYDSWRQALAYNINARDIPSLIPIIETCIQTKQTIVSADPFDHDQRHALNLGHTIGHALERITHAPHGYCVVWGMVGALYLSVIRCGCPRNILTQLTHLMIDCYGRPDCNCRQYDHLLSLIHQDKKNSAHNTLFTLLREPGQPLIHQPIPDPQILETLDYLFSL